MAQPHPKVLLAGLSGLDMVPSLPTDGNILDKLVPGRIVPIGEMTFSVGGAVLNTGVALHRLGVGARLLTNVGDDEFGSILVDIVGGYLRQKDGHRIADSELVVLREEGGTTSYTIVISSPEMDRIFLGHVGVNAHFEVGMVTDEHLDGIELFHFGYPPILERVFIDEGRGLANLLADVQRRGIVTSLDMCMPDANSSAETIDWPQYLSRVLPHVDIFMPSLEESMFMLHPERFHQIKQLGSEFSLHFTEDDLLRVSETFLSMGACIVGLKLGSAGLFVQTGDLSGLKRPLAPCWWQCICEDAQWSNRQVMSTCFAVDVAGTAGSGDATIGGFLAAIVRGLPLDDCISYGLAVGGCSVELPDTVSGIRNWDETSDRIENGNWGRLRSVIDDFGWKQSGSHYYGPKDRVKYPQ